MEANKNKTKTPTSNPSSTSTTRTTSPKAASSSTSAFASSITKATASSSASSKAKLSSKSSSREAHRSSMASSTGGGSAVTVPRVSRTKLCKRLLHALNEDGLAMLSADKGYGAQSLAREAAAYLKARKHRVLLYNFSSVAASEISNSLKALIERVETGKKTYLFLLDIPAPPEKEIQGMLSALKKLHKRARLCITGSSGLVLLDEMLQEQVCAHSTIFAQDLLVREEEYTFFAPSDEETYQVFLKATNGIISLAENRYQTKKHRTCRNEDLLLAALQRAEIKEEKKLCFVLALLGEGSLRDLKELGLKVSPEALSEFARHAPIFGITQMSEIEQAHLDARTGGERQEVRGGKWLAMPGGVGQDISGEEGQKVSEKDGQEAFDAASLKCLCTASSFALPQGVTCPPAILEQCLQEFEETFFAIITKLLGEGRASQAYTYLSATTSHKKVQRYILAHASSIYERGGAELLLQAGVFFDECGTALTRCESEFLKITCALSQKRTRRWMLECGITAELLTSSDAEERAQMQHLILLYEIAHHYKSVRHSMCVSSDSYAPLEHYDPGLPQELRSLASFLFIRRAFLQNDLGRAAQRAEIARVDCNYTSFSGALLTLALFEVGLLEAPPSPDDVAPGNLDELPPAVKGALEFLHRPGYETVYTYERSFLELFLNVVESDSLVSCVRDVQAVSVKNKDDVMLVVTLCALAYNELMTGQLQRSLGAVEEAAFLAKKAHIPLLQEITSVLAEALRPAKKHAEQKTAHVLTLESTPDLIRFILRQTKRKMLLKRESHESRETSISEGTGFDKMPPTLVAAPFSLNGLWAGLLHLLIEKVEDVGVELFPELPVQWRNVLVEKSRSFKKRQEERAAREATSLAAFPARPAPHTAYLISAEGAGTYTDFATSPVGSATHTASLASLEKAVMQTGISTTQKAAASHTAQDLDAAFSESSLFGLPTAQAASFSHAYPVSSECCAVLHAGKSAKCGAVSHPGQSAEPLTYPILHINLLDNFSIRLGDMSLPETVWRRESSKNILILLAAASGHTLSRQVLFHKLWPELNYQEHANNLYTALSDLRKAFLIHCNQTRRSVPYIISRHGMLSLNEQVVEVDIDELFAATKKVTHPATSDSVKRIKALEILILFGRGPKFPRGFSQIPEADYLKNQLARDFAAASIEGALAAWRMGYFRDATKLALAAVAASQLQEDIVADAMKLLIDMGKTEEVHRMYRVFHNHYRKLFGTNPEGEIKRLYQTFSRKKGAPLKAMIPSGEEKRMKLAA